MARKGQSISALLLELPAEVNLALKDETGYHPLRVGGTIAHSITSRAARTCAASP